jgi:hypothetical protein
MVSTDRRIVPQFLREFRCVLRPLIHRRQDEMVRAAGIDEEVSPLKGSSDEIGKTFVKTARVLHEKDDPGRAHERLWENFARVPESLVPSSYLDSGMRLGVQSGKDPSVEMPSESFF